MIIGGSRYRNSILAYGGECCSNLRNFNKRSSPKVTDSKVLTDLKESSEQICSIDGNSKSCKVSKQHVEDAEKSMSNPSSPLEMVDDTVLSSMFDKDSKKVTFDVYTTPCPCKETTEQAQAKSKEGLCNPDNKDKILDFVEDFVKTYEKRKGNVKPANVEDTDNINVKKAANIIKHNCTTEECVLSSVVEDNMDEGGICSTLGFKSELNDECKGPLKPDGPRNNTGWLSNDNTDDVLRDIEKEFPEFFPFKTTMTDFSEGGDRWLGNSKEKSLSNSFNIIKKYINSGDKTCFGCIINTDKTKNCKSGKCGTHWVCIFVDCRKSSEVPWTIEYFDSVGDPPSSEVCTWQEDLKKKIEIYREDKGDRGGVICEANNIQHQSGNNECGVYTTYFIRSRVEGIPFSRFLNRRLPDSVMISYRRHLFSSRK
uniref:Ubiquitin-like protease family profile domain-containing protein n=1 Tax=viral metagenome TaxID=1070528 RepID=A0A6C0LLE5_9ZZZZ